MALFEAKNIETESTPDEVESAPNQDLAMLDGTMLVEEATNRKKQMEEQMDELLSMQVILMDKFVSLDAMALNYN